MENHLRDGINWDGERLTISVSSRWAREKLAALYDHLQAGATFEFEFIERRTPTLSLVLSAVAPPVPAAPSS